MKFIYCFDKNRNKEKKNKLDNEGKEIDCFSGFATNGVTVQQQPLSQQTVPSSNLNSNSNSVSVPPPPPPPPMSLNQGKKNKITILINNFSRESNSKKILIPF